MHEQLEELYLLPSFKVWSLKTSGIHGYNPSGAPHTSKTNISKIQRKLRLNPEPPFQIQPDLNLFVLFQHKMLLLSPLFEAIGRSKSVFHELYVLYFSVFIDLTPDRKRADGHLPRGSRALHEAAKDHYVFSGAEEGLDLEASLA